MDPLIIIFLASAFSIVLMLSLKMYELSSGKRLLIPIHFHHKSDHAIRNAFLASERWVVFQIKKGFHYLSLLPGIVIRLLILLTRIVLVRMAKLIDLVKGKGKIGDNRGQASFFITRVKEHKEELRREREE